MRLDDCELMNIKCSHLETKKFFVTNFVLKSVLDFV